jgi:hypothetical protein
MSNKRISPKHHTDAHFWHHAALQTHGPGRVGKFDLYRWALRYEQLARKRHGCGVNLRDVLAELNANWQHFGGPDGLNLEEAIEAITRSWHRSEELTADSIANHRQFTSPPMFTEKGNLVPRNVDESNT